MKSLNELAKEIVQINKSNGWKVMTPEDWGNSEDPLHPYKIPTSLALIGSEVSEALEAFRKTDKENFREELADTMIRVLDLCGGLGIDIETEILNKMEKNRNRGFKHGGKIV